MWGEIKKDPGITTDELRNKMDQEYERRKVVSDRGIKFSDVRPSDMKFNKTIELPDPCDHDQETLIQYQKFMTTSTADKYREENCDQKR